MNSKKEIFFYGVYQGCVPGVYTSVSIVKEIPSGECRRFKRFEDACHFAATGKVKYSESSSSKGNSDKVIVKNENSPKDEKSSTVQDNMSGMVNCS